MKLLASLPVEFPNSQRRTGRWLGRACRLVSICVAASIAGAFASGSIPQASAQVVQASPPTRSFPADTRVGVFEILAYPDAAIDGKPVRLAAGSQIRNRSNLIVLPTTVVGQVAVRYRLDPSGQLSRVWVLTSAEIEAATAAQRP